MQAAIGAGLPVPFYIGDRWIPRHVVLAVAALPDGVTVYNPAHGTLDPMAASDFEAAKLTTFGKLDQALVRRTPGQVLTELTVGSTAVDLGRARSSPVRGHRPVASYNRRSS